jgi:hypothetical protein
MYVIVGLEIRTFVTQLRFGSDFCSLVAENTKIFQDIEWG